MKGEEFEKFLEENKEIIESFRRINEEYVKDVEALARDRIEHPEWYEPEHKEKMLKKYLEKHKDIKVVELKEKDTKK